MEAFRKLATTYFPTNAVSSALVGLTSLFGMGRGEHHRNNHQKIFIHQPADQFFFSIKNDIFDERKYKSVDIKRISSRKLTGN